MGSGQVDPALSAKRAEAGRRGAEARWAKANAGKRPEPSRWLQEIQAWRTQRPKDVAGWRIENAAAEAEGPAEMYIYDEIDGSGWWGISARDVIEALMQVTAPSINLHLNSPGGDVFDAYAIYNALRNHPATVDVIVDGLAASAASYIMLAGDTVTMEPNASVMIHDAITFTYGNEADHAQSGALLGKQSGIVAQIYAERAGGTAEEWRAAMKAETWYTADEAVAAGLADSVRSQSRTDDAMQDTAGATKVYGEAARLTLPTATSSTSTTDDGGADLDDDTDWAAVAEQMSNALEGAFE